MTGHPYSSTKILNNNYNNLQKDSEICNINVGTPETFAGFPTS